jgi:hypothetical protein
MLLFGANVWTAKKKHCIVPLLPPIKSTSSSIDGRDKANRTAMRLQSVNSLIIRSAAIPARSRRKRNHHPDKSPNLGIIRRRRRMSGKCGAYTSAGYRAYPRDHEFLYKQCEAPALVGIFCVKHDSKYRRTICAFDCPVCRKHRPALYLPRAPQTVRQCKLCDKAQHRRQAALDGCTRNSRNRKHFIMKVMRETGLLLPPLQQIVASY